MLLAMVSLQLLGTCEASQPHRSTHDALKPSIDAPASNS
jgi:hypothetical protein